MPGFARHAERRPEGDLEDFFNPLATFERVVVASPGGPQRELGSLSAVPLPPVPARPWTIALGELAYAAADPLAGAIRRLAAETRADLVAQRYGSPLFHGLPAVWAARRLGLPALVTLNNDYPAILAHKRPSARWARRLLEPAVWRYLFRHAAALWCVSGHVRRQALALGARRSKLVTIPNKEALDRFARPADPAVARRLLAEAGLPPAAERRPLLLSVGRLIEQKNYRRMLAAFADLAERHPAAAWVIVGRGPQRPLLADRIRRRGLERSVSIVGRDLAVGELAALYQRVDALFFVSRFEGHGRVAFEALACGTPVVGSARLPIAEMVIDGETGAVADPDSVAEIVAALERVGSGEIARESHGERCRAVARRYDLARINPLEADLYRRLLDRRRPVAENGDGGGPGG